MMERDFAYQTRVRAMIFYSRWDTWSSFFLLLPRLLLVESAQLITLVMSQ
jgi:hypothetical protein